MKLARILIFIIGFAHLAAGHARAGTLLELYTSQGCSSCPSADALLLELDRDPDIIALAFHVDYWDYLGVIDNFADPIFSARQIAYQAKKGEKNVYTPQFIVAGEASFPGAERSNLLARLGKSRRENLIGANIIKGPRNYRVDLVARQPLAGRFDVMVAYVLPTARVNFTSGENAGRTVEYGRIVQKLTSVGKWNGGETISVDIPVQRGLEAVLFVQEDGLGRVPFAIDLP